MKHMTNEEIYTEMMQISKRIDELFKAKKLNERNELVPRWRELYRAYDFGFKVGQDVELRGKNKPAKILEHNKDDNNFLARKDTGGEVWVPGTILREITKQEITTEPKQTTIFDFLEV